MKLLARIWSFFTRKKKQFPTKDEIEKRFPRLDNVNTPEELEVHIFNVGCRVGAYWASSESQKK